MRCWHLLHGRTAEAAHLLGTDDVGRDVLSRLMYGARLSLLVGCLVVVLSLIMGIVLGPVAGYFGGIVDNIIMRVVDIMLALPSLLLALVLVAIFGPSIGNAALALTFVALPHYVRLTRAAVLVEVNRDYVTASRVAGAGAMRQMFINIFPNCLAPLIVQASLGFSNAILDMAALGLAWVRSRQHRSGAPCSPTCCSSRKAPGGSSPSRVWRFC